MNKDNKKIINWSFHLLTSIIIKKWVFIVEEQNFFSYPYTDRLSKNDNDKGTYKYF